MDLQEKKTPFSPSPSPSTTIVSNNTTTRVIQQSPLIELFEPSSPSRPHHNENTPRRRRSWVADELVASCSGCQSRFTIFLRRHHCRRCGLIFCNDCSNNRLTHLVDSQDKNYYRLCNPCADELLNTEQVELISNNQQQCGIGFALKFRKVIAISHHLLPQQWSPTTTLPIPPQPSLNDNNLLLFDEDVVVGPAAPSSRINAAPAPLPFAPIVSPNSTPTNESLLSRIATVALSFPLKFRMTSTTNDGITQSDFLNIPPNTSNFESCPVCSLSFQKWKVDKVQEHVENCITRTTQSGSILGNRYTTFQWYSSPSQNKDCTICFEEFQLDQSIAVLNCLCQFHEKCIEAWFERGKSCPFHSG